MAKINKVNLSIDDLNNIVDDKKYKEGKLWHIFTSRILMTRSLIIFLNW